MLQTLFYIPAKVGGLPLFGPWGLATAAWGLGCALYLLWAWRRGISKEELAGQAPMLLMMLVLLAVIVPRLGDADGRLPVRGFGMAVLAGIFAGTRLATSRAKRMGVDPEVVLSMAWWMFIAGFVGARAFYVIEYRRDFLVEKPNSAGLDWLATFGKVANITQGGIIVYGSFVGALIALLVFARRYKLPALALCDLVAPSMVLGLALGRIGCLFNGCCYGRVCELPWAVTFPPGSPPFVRQVDTEKIPYRDALGGLEFADDPSLRPVVLRVAPDSEVARQGYKPGMRIMQVAGVRVEAIGQVRSILVSLRPGEQASLQIAGEAAPRIWSVPGDVPRSKPVHPTQIYSSINGLLICLLLLAYYPYRSRDGEVLALLASLYPIARFLEESLRTDEPPIGFTGLTLSQNLSILMFLAAGCFWWWLWRQPRGSVLPPKDKIVTFAVSDAT